MTESNFIDNCAYLYNNYCYPVFFKKIEGPPIWPVIVVSIIIFITIAEIGSQSCQNGKCNHYKNINIAKSSDPSSRKIDEIVSRINLNHTSVGWRRALIISIILSLTILMYFSTDLPDGYDFFLVATILFIVIYLFSVWFQWHWWKGRDYKIENKLLDLRHNIKKMEFENNSYFNSRNSNYTNNISNSSVLSYIYSI